MKRSNSIGMWIAIGVGIGTAIGAGMHDFGECIAIGIAIGASIGLVIDARHKNDHKNIK